MLSRFTSAFFVFKKIYFWLAGLTPLALAMSSQLHLVAELLLKSGANVNVTDADGNTLLHLALLDANSDASLFLLNHGADVNLRTKDNETCLELAIKKSLKEPMEILCKLGNFCKSGNFARFCFPKWSKKWPRNGQIILERSKYGPKTVLEFPKVSLNAAKFEIQMQPITLPIF